MYIIFSESNESPKIEFSTVVIFLRLSITILSKSVLNSIKPSFEIRIDYGYGSIYNNFPVPVTH